MKLVIDLQILQTPARFRGMGQYLMSLLDALGRDKTFGSLDGVTLLVSSKHPFDKKLSTQLKQMLPNSELISLPLVTLADDSDTKRAMDHNRELINSWWQESGHKEDSAFFIPAVFQAEIYPVFPDNSKKHLLAYDVIPLQLYTSYAAVMRWKDYLYRYSELYRADSVLCISKTTANALQIYAALPAEKIVVVDGGPAVLPAPVEPTSAVPKKFILMPTGNDLRKNNHNAVTGFDLFNQSEDFEYSLVITSSFTEDEKRALSNISRNVVFTDNVKDEELAWLYENSELVLFPSVLEGLGMPLIEALAYNKPVAASRIDVFEEISKDLPYYFNPFDPVSICNTLSKVIADSDFKERQKQYKDVLDTYSWERSAKIVLSSLLSKHVVAKKQKNKRVAVFCPSPEGISAVGKFVAEMHPVLAEYCEVDYYFEPPSLKKQLRPDIIGSFAPTSHPTHFNKTKYNKYDGVIYHIGNGGHHSLTTMHALTLPSVVILHDLNIENVFNDLLSAKKIDKNRYNVEEELNNRNGNRSKFLTTVSNRQKSIIVHSDYAKTVVGEALAGDSSVRIVKANLPTNTPQFVIDERQEGDEFVIGLAGILANIKGLEVIENIATNPLFKHDKIMLFGLNFAEPGALDRLQKLPNVDVATDLSDYEFQERMKRLSIFVNYRKQYQGEASSATLEAMRYGVPVMVRSDFGWYAELPDDAVIKVADESEIAEKLVELKNSPKKLKQIGEKARITTETQFSTREYVERLLSAIGDDSEK